MLITKADIAAYADFTVNISDAKVDFQIKDAGLMDVAPVIGRENYEKLLALQPLPVEPPVEEPTEPVVITLEEGPTEEVPTEEPPVEEVPTEETPTEETPTEEPLPVPVVDLHAFYQAVVPFWAMCAYRRLFSIHGVDVTQAGVTTPRGQDYEQISDKRRGEILGQIRSKVHFYQSELETYLRANNLLPKVDACSEAPNRRNFGVAIAKTRKQ